MTQSILGLPARVPIDPPCRRRCTPQMPTRREKALRRTGAKPSFAGTGLLERMRSTTFAILGITAAMCLGLVAIVSQQGFPVLPALPIPGLSTEREQVHEGRIAAQRPSPALGTAVEASVVRGAASGGGGEPERSGSSDSSGVSGSRQLATAPVPVPSEPADDGGSEEEPPAAPVAASPPTDAAVATPLRPAPAAPPIVATPPDKGTAAVDSSEDDEEGAEVGSSQGDSDEQEVDTAEVEYSPAFPEVDEDSTRGRDRGNGPRRPGR